MTKKLFISIKEDFCTAAKAGDFSSPDLAQVKGLLDQNGLALRALSNSTGTHRLAKVFFVVGEKAHDAELIKALKSNAAVAYVEKPIRHF